MPTMPKNYRNYLWIIFFVTLSARLLVAFSQPNFTYESYFHLRQAESIRETGLPLYADPLSYGGRVLVFLPLFHYVLAFFNLILPLDIVGKLIPNILLSLLTIIAYALSLKITKSETASLFAAFIAGFLPILFVPNSTTPLSLFLPLIFISIHAFLTLHEKKYPWIYLLSFLSAALTSSLAFLLLLGFGVYLLLCFLEHQELRAEEREVIIFSIIFYVWLQLLFFKDILLKEGPEFVWQNIPSQIINQYFPKISLVEALLSVSIIPFLVGLYVVYHSLFTSKEKTVFLLLSCAIAAALLAWFRFIEFQTALAFFGMVLAVLFSLFYQASHQYVQKTKVFWLPRAFPALVAVLLAASLWYPAAVQTLHQDLPTPEEITAFQSLRHYASGNNKALALLKEGHLVTYYGGVKNLMDDQFSLVENEERFRDITTLYTTQFQTEALDLLEKYDIDYLILTSSAQEEMGLERFSYLTPECFALKYKNTSRIYERKCSLREKREKQP